MDVNERSARAQFSDDDGGHMFDLENDDFMFEDDDSSFPMNSSSGNTRSTTHNNISIRSSNDNSRQDHQYLLKVNNFFQSLNSTIFHPSLLFKESRKTVSDKIQKSLAHGIELYNMDNHMHDTDHAHNNDNDNDNDNDNHNDRDGLKDLQNMLSFHTKLRRRRFFQKTVVRLVGFTAVLLLFLYLLLNGLGVVSPKGLRSHKYTNGRGGKTNNNNKDSTGDGSHNVFSPYKLYSNGTMQMYPVTLLLNLGGVSPLFLNSIDTPILDKLYRRDLSGDLVGEPLENSTESSLEHVLAQTGVLSTPYMIPGSSFQTIPNLWSLITGLDPEYHKIYNNNFDLFFSKILADDEKQEAKSANEDASAQANEAFQKSLTKYNFNGFDVALQEKEATSHIKNPQKNMYHLDQVYNGNDSIWAQIQTSYFNKLNGQFEFKCDVLNWPGSLVDYSYESNFTKPFYLQQSSQEKSAVKYDGQEYLYSSLASNIKKKNKKVSQFNVLKTVDYIFHKIDAAAAAAAATVSEASLGKEEEIPGLVIHDIPVMGEQGFYDDPLYYAERLQMVDEYIKQILSGVAQRNMTHMFNLVVTSDHGTATIPMENIHTWDEYIYRDKELGQEVDKLLSSSSYSYPSSSSFPLFDEETDNSVGLVVFHSPYLGFTHPGLNLEQWRNFESSVKGHSGDASGSFVKLTGTDSESKEDLKKKNFYQLYSLLKDVFANSPFHVLQNHNLPANLKYLDKMHNGQDTLWVIPEYNHYLIPPNHKELLKTANAYDDSANIFQNFNMKKFNSETDTLAKTLFVNGYDCLNGSVKELSIISDQLEMSSLFVGVGPYFEKFESYDLKPFKNVEVYQILSDMIGLRNYNKNNNGTFAYPLSLGEEKLWLWNSGDGMNQKDAASWDDLGKKFGARGENSFLKKWVGAEYLKWREENVAMEVDAVSSAAAETSSTETSSTTTLSTTFTSAIRSSASSSASSLPTLSSDSPSSSTSSTTTFSSSSSSSFSSTISPTSTSTHAQNLNDVFQEIVSDIKEEAQELMDKVNDILAGTATLA
ncbi:hypothetical protein ACO0QE_003993 [Hanseniaspora vineae]